MSDAGRHVCRAAGGTFPIVGDGDTGFGGIANVRRTVLEYHRAGFAGVTVEDQVFPKRCAFARGMKVVSRAEALVRLAAALEMRDEIRRGGGDILVVGRTDCRVASNVEDGFEEAMWRCAAFADLGCDVVYFEGPDGTAEMEALNARVTAVPTMLAQVEKPGRPLLSAAECAEVGYDAVLYGLTLLSASAAAVERAIEAMGAGEHPTAAASTRGGERSSGEGLLMPFDDLYDAVGFTEHFDLEARFDPDLFRAE